MANLQFTGFILVLLCAWTTVSAGLLPEGGSNGYQYNRPSNGAFGSADSDLGRRGYAGDAPERFVGPGANGFDFTANRSPTNAYGPPSYNGFKNNIGFQAGRPGGVYAGSNNGYTGSGNYPGASGTNGLQPGFNGFADNYRYRYNTEDNRPRPYSFQYEVRDPPSGNDYGQQETSDGNVVRGEYRVLLPDSRTQIVKYTADDVNGYNADVQYEGQAQFPRPGGAPGSQFSSSPETSYQAGFGSLGPYQGRGSYNGPSGGGFPVGGNGGIFGSSGGVAVGAGPGNQYLPPGGGYGK